MMRKFQLQMRINNDDTITHENKLGRQKRSFTLFFLHNWQTSTADDHNGDYAFQFINGGASRDQGGRGGGGGMGGVGCKGGRR